MEPKAAVDFVLSTCLLAMGDLANVKKIAEEEGWSRVSDVLPLNTKIEKSRAQWQAPDFYELTSSLLLKGMERRCFIVFRPAKVERDGFLEAISVALELKSHCDNTFPQSGWRREVYDIIGQNLRYHRAEAKALYYV